jgi:hypothetical protein
MTTRAIVVDVAPLEALVYRDIVVADPSTLIAIKVEEDGRLLSLLQILAPVPPKVNTKEGKDETTRNIGKIKSTKNQRYLRRAY